MPRNLEQITWFLVCLVISLVCTLAGAFRLVSRLSAGAEFPVSAVFWIVFGLATFVLGIWLLVAKPDEDSYRRRKRVVQIIKLGAGAFLLYGVYVASNLDESTRGNALATGLKLVVVALFYFVLTRKVGKARDD